MDEPNNDEAKPPAEAQEVRKHRHASEPAPQAAQAERFEAVLRIDPKPGAKHFRGVWLESEGERVLIAYRAEPWWKDFEGKRVSVQGEAYSPAPYEQAIQAPHFRVRHLKLLEPTHEDLGLVEVWAEETLTGRFKVRVGAPGTKLEGETRVIFEADDGTVYALANRPPEPSPPVNQPVTLVARRVEPTPFVARVGGPYLWIISAQAQESQQ